MDAADGISATVRSGDRTAWLSALFAPAAARAALLALAAYRLELARIAAAAREPLAAEIRLQWWRDAIADVGTGAGRSLPLVDALRDGAARYGWPVETLCAVSEAHIHDLYADPFGDFSAFDGYSGEVFGALTLLGAMTLGVEARGPDAGLVAARSGATAAGWAGVVLAAADAALFAAGDFARGRTRVPASAFPVDPRPALLLQKRPEGAQEAVLALVRHGERADAQMRACLPQVDATVRAAFLPALVARSRLAAAARRPLAPVPPADWRLQLALWREARLI